MILFCWTLQTTDFFSVTWPYYAWHSVQPTHINSVPSLPPSQPGALAAIALDVCIQIIAEMVYLSSRAQGQKDISPLSPLQCCCLALDFVHRRATSWRMLCKQTPTTCLSLRSRRQLLCEQACCGSSGSRSPASPSGCRERLWPLSAAFKCCLKLISYFPPAFAHMRTCQCGQNGTLHKPQLLPP